MYTYRKDIDGLKALAVLTVMVYHYGFLPCGYYGVDIFFVISGYLITGIIYKETIEDRFSILQFYLRRIGRIIPLLLLVSLVALIIGSMVMLPDDLENLSESVIATNLFGNNILQLITTHNYWDVVNEFKPLIHTWSLGVEEQYYLLYPILFLVFRRKKVKWLLPVLFLLTFISILLFMGGIFGAPEKYYLLPFRFFELSIGGIGAILFQERLIKHHFTPLLIISLLVIMHLPDHTLPLNVAIFITVFITFGLLVSSISNNNISSLILENKVMVFIGKISFSLYMWHQLVLAFTRYAITEPVSNESVALVILCTFTFALLSYYLVEQPFRNGMRIAPGKPFIILVIAFVISTGAAAYIYLHSGVIRDVPELEIKKEAVTRYQNRKYNTRIYEYDHPFGNTGKIKVLIAGNSFARDWANVLLESEFINKLDISYAKGQFKNAEMQLRLKQADYIFVSDIPKEAFFIRYLSGFVPDTTKVYCIGFKNFGVSNGIFYNHIRNNYYFKQRATISKSYMLKNKILKTQWGNKYIDLISMYADSTGSFQVFTPSGIFISQDCMHLTRAGADYFARKLASDTGFILNKTSVR